MLIDNIRIERNDNKYDPEDFLSESLNHLWPNDVNNSHGDPEATIVYTSSKLDRDIRLKVADPITEDERQLFGHALWNSSVQLAEFISNDRQYHVQDETVLELGAGVGLAGIVAALSQSTYVMVSDYPSKAILEMLEGNVKANIPEDLRCRIEVVGHVWGNFDDCMSKAKKHSFSRILACDLLWIMGQHTNLVRSILHFLALDTDARAWIVAGFHTGRAIVSNFFDVVEQEGLLVTSVYEMDVEGNIRPWQKIRDKGHENVTERKRWQVIAELRRSN